MRGFDGLRGAAIEHAAMAVGQRTGLDASMLADLLDDATLPGFLALLGFGAGSGDASVSVDGEFLASVAAGVAAQPEAAGRGLDAGRVEGVLRDVLVGRRGVRVGSGQGGRDGGLWALAVPALERETGMQLTEAQWDQARELLMSGEFFGDAAHAVAAVVHAIPGMPVALVRDVRTSPLRIARLTVAVARDLQGGLGTAHRVVADLLADGDLDERPAVLVHTLEALFRFAGVQSVAGTLGQLVHPDNKAVRLAVVAYARANGIPLRESDLDLVRATLLASDRPDLGPLLTEAGTRLAERYGAARFRRLLARLDGKPDG